MPAPVVSIAQDEILTGEAVALDVQPVGLIMRSLGALIDFLVSAALAVLMLILMAYLLSIGALDDETSRIYAIAMIVLIAIILPTTVETLTRGRSLGKLAVGARIVRADGGRIGVRHASLRALVGFLEIYMTIGGLAFVTGIFTPRAQRLGDLVAGTYSERTRSVRIPDTAVPLPPVLTSWAPIADVGRLPVRLGRRLSQFVQSSEGMMPAARMRIAAELAAETATFVSPVPPVDPETFLRGVLVVRRERELRSLELEDKRASALLPPPR